MKYPYSNNKQNEYSHFNPSLRDTKAEIICAKEGAIKQAKDGTFRVQSQSKSGFYKVVPVDGWPNYVCECPAFKTDGGPCKHTQAVRFFLIDGPENPHIKAVGDLDGDGRSAVEEYVLGTDPRSRASCFELAIDSRPPQGAVIRFRAAGATGPGYTRCSRFYALEMTDDLVRVPFAPLSGYGRITGRDQWVAATNTVHDRRVFYRGRVWLGRE